MIYVNDILQLSWFFRHQNNIPAAHWGWGRVGGVAEGAQYQDRLAGLHQDGPAAVCVVGVSARVAGGGEGASSLSGDQVTIQVPH